MLEVPQKYREMADSDAREIAIKVVIGNTVLTNDDVIELDIYRSLGESGFNIGGVVASRLRLLALMKLPYSGEITMDVFVRFGLDDENASEYVQFGHFYGHASNPSYKTAQVEIVGYDKLGSSGFNSRCTFAKAGNAELKFPCTLQEMLEYVCIRKGLECEFECLDYTVSEMPVKDRSRDDSDYEKYYTYKEIVGFIAAAHGASAAIDNNGKLVFIGIKESEETVNSGDCIDFALTYSEQFTVKGILLHVQNVLSTGSTNIFINDDSKTAYDGEISEGVVETSCPFGSIEIAENLWGQLGGFSYNSCEFTRRGRGWTELGDIIKAVDNLDVKLGGEYKNRQMIAQTIEWSFTADGGFTEHIISKAENSEESAERLGSGNAIANTNGTGESAEKIKFIRNGVQYGAAGIHDIDGETGVALSITEASKWLAFLDENGEKILEYVPQNKRDEIENGLWFLPVKSKNVPSFDGIYYSNPANHDFDALGEVNSLPYSILNSTIFCFGGEDTNKIKNLGFKNAVDGTSFNGDVWEINSMTCTVTTWENQGGGQAGYFSGIRLSFDTFSVGYSISLGSRPVSVKNFGLVFTIPSNKWYKNNELVGYFSSPTIFNFGNYDGSYYHKLGELDTYYSLTDEAYVRFWKDIIEAPSNADSPSEVPKNTIRIYKNIVLMNGAKILNEDGTEYMT